MHQLLGLLTVGLLAAPGAIEPKRPNILWIVVDDASANFSCYGEKTIRDEKPYVVKHADGKWTIDGSMPGTKNGEMVVGGTFHIIISQKDARILEIGHGA